MSAMCPHSCDINPDHLPARRIVLTSNQDMFVRGWERVAGSVGAYSKCSNTALNPFSM